MRAEKEPIINTILLQNNCPDNIISANPGEMLYRDGRIFYKVVNDTELVRIEVAFKSFAYPDYANRWYASTNENWKYKFKHPYELWIKESGIGTKIGWKFVGFKKLFIDYVKMTVTPTPTPTPTPSVSSTNTPTPTPSLSVSNTPTPTPTPSPAPTIFPKVGISSYSYPSYSEINDLDADLLLLGLSNPGLENPSYKFESVYGDGVLLNIETGYISNSSTKIYKSIDGGKTWTTIALPTGLNGSTRIYHGVYANNGTFILAGNYDTILTSSDYGNSFGIASHSYNNGTAFAPYEPYYPYINNAEYSALIQVGNRTIATKYSPTFTQDSSSILCSMGEYSDDGGRTWVDIDITSQSFGSDSSIGFSPRFKSITYGDGKLVAIGSAYKNTTGSWGNNLASIYSTDLGETWSDITYITGTNFNNDSTYCSNEYQNGNKMVYGNGNFICIPSTYTSSSLLISNNGIDWNIISPNIFNSSNSNFSSIAFSGGIFFALKQYAYGKSGQGIVYYTSIDGINWAEHFYSGIATTGYFTTILDLNDQTIDYPSPIKTSNRGYSTIPTNYTASLAIELTGSSGEITLNQTCQYNLLYNNTIWYKFTDTASLYRQFTAHAFSASIDCLPISMTIYKNTQTGSLELSEEFNRNDSKEITIGFDSEPNIEYYIMLDVGRQGSRDSRLNFKYDTYPTQSIPNSTIDTAIELSGSDIIVTSSILSNKARWYSWTPVGHRTFISISFADTWSYNSYNYNKNSNISFYYISGSELQSGSLKSLYIRSGECEKTGGYYTDRSNYIIPTESKYYFKISADYEIYKPTQYLEYYFGGGGWDGKFDFRIKDVTGNLQPTTSFALDFIQNFPRLPINMDSNEWGVLTASLTSSILTRAVDSRAPYFRNPAAALFGYADYYYIPKESITKQGSIVLQISSSTKDFYPIVHAGSNAESVVSGEPYWYNYIEDGEHIIPFVGRRLYVGKDNQPYSFTVTSSVDYFIRIIGMISNYSGSSENSTKMYGDYSLRYKFVEEDTSIPTFIHISGSYIDYNVTYTSKSFSPRSISSLYSAWRSYSIAVRPDVKCKMIASIAESSTCGKEDRAYTWERLSHEPSAKIPTIQSNITASFYNPRLFFSTASWYICNPTIQTNCSAGDLRWFDIQQAYSDKLNIRIRTLETSSYNNPTSPYEFSGSSGNIIFDENKYSRTCYIKYVSTDNGLLEVIPNGGLSFSETSVQYSTTISGSVVTGNIYPSHSSTQNSVSFPIKSGSSYLFSIRNDYTTNELLNYSGTGFSYNILPEYYSPNFDEQHATIITGSEITLSGYNNMKVFDDPSTVRLNWWKWIPTETGIATIDNTSFTISSSRLPYWSGNCRFIAYQGEEYLMSLNPLGYPTASISLKANSKQLGNKNTSIQNAFLFTSSYVNINQNTICNTDTWEMYKYYWKYNIFTSQSITASISSVGNLEISKQPSSSVEFISLGATGSLYGDQVILYATASAGDVVYITYTPTSNLLYTINGTIIIPVPPPPPPPPPSNDSFYNATELIGLSGQLTGSNTSATIDPADPSGVNAIRSIWYTWTPLITGTATLSTIGSNFDTYMYLYKLNDGAIVSQSNLTFIASDDDSGGGRVSKIITNLTSGSRYYIAVGGYNSSYVGNIVFNYSI